MPEIRLFGVSKYYDPNITAVDDLNFTIQNGEYLSLLGPSGCGKTTTLRLLSGLTEPSKGKIHWDGERVEHLGPDERDLGYVFQQFAIFPHLTVYDNIAFGPRVKGFSSEDEEENVEKYIQLMGLGDKINKYPDDLGAADLQRVGIARVLATGARTLLLDEPMGALDHKIRERFQDELRRLVKDLGLTAIHVTHDQSEAMAISDRIAVMKKGKLVQLGTPEDLLFDPSRIFTAHFIGESDFFEGVVIKREQNSMDVELIGDEIIQLPTDHSSPLPGTRVVIGVRKEFYEIETTEKDKQEHKEKNILIGDIISDRFVGEKWRTRVQLPYGRSLEAKRLPHKDNLGKGKRVKVKIPTNAAFLFKYPDAGLEEALSVT